MKLTELFAQKKPSLSFEVFPPKTWDAYESVKQATEEIAALSPSYMSVTYGAGGGTSDHTVRIAADLQKKYGVPTLAHLSCVSSTKAEIHAQLDRLRENGIENILSLRGDLPADADRSSLEYHYASELTAEIAAYGGFCIGGACYPEIHPESASQTEDIQHLKEKVDAGCDFLTTQMFFDNNLLYNFLYKIREAGITVPIIPGIMPITNASHLERSLLLSGSFVPQRFKSLVDKFGSNPAAMKQAGIAYATDQIIDLYANGITDVHVYSMNKPDIAAAIQANVSAILGR